MIIRGIGIDIDLQNYVSFNHGNAEYCLNLVSHTIITRIHPRKLELRRQVCFSKRFIETNLLNENALLRFISFRLHQLI